MANWKLKVAIVGAFAFLIAGAGYWAFKHVSHTPPTSLGQETAQKLPGFEFGEELKQRVPGAALPVEAVEFLGFQMEAGSLPGLVKGDHVALRLPDSAVMPNGVFQSAFTGAVHYPLTVTVHADVNGEGFLHHYEVARASEKSPWELRRAWRTDTDGRVREEYHVGKRSN